MSHCFIFFTTIVPLFAGDLCGSSPSIQKYQDILNGTDNSHFKIIGGRESVNGDWPWLIQLEYGTIVKRHGWAGTIIGAKWVLTATHCEITPESDHVIHYGKLQRR